MAYQDFRRMESHQWGIVGRSENPVPGDEDAVLGMAARYGHLRDSFENMNSFIRGVDPQSGAKGEWAKKLSDTIDDSIKKDFPQWQDIFTTLHTELKSWASELLGFRTEGERYITKAEEAKGQRDKASSQANSARAQVKTKQGVLDTAADDSRQNAQDDLDRAQADLQKYEDSISSAEAVIAEQKHNIDSLASRYDAAAERHVSRIGKTRYPEKLEGFEAFHYSAAWNVISEVLKYASVVLAVGMMLFPGVGWLAALGLLVDFTTLGMNVGDYLGHDIGRNEFLVDLGFGVFSCAAGFLSVGKIFGSNSSLSMAKAFVFGKGGACKSVGEGFSAAFHSARAGSKHMIPSMWSGLKSGVKEGFTAAKGAEHSELGKWLLTKANPLYDYKTAYDSVKACKGARGFGKLVTGIDAFKDISTVTNHAKPWLMPIAKQYDSGKTDFAGGIKLAWKIQWMALPSGKFLQKAADLF